MIPDAIFNAITGTAINGMTRSKSMFMFVKPLPGIPLHQLNADSKIFVLLMKVIRITNILCLCTQASLILSTKMQLHECSFLYFFLFYCFPMTKII